MDDRRDAQNAQRVEEIAAQNVAKRQVCLPPDSCNDGSRQFRQRRAHRDDGEADQGLGQAGGFCQGDGAGYKQLGAQDGQDKPGQRQGQGGRQPLRTRLGDFGFRAVQIRRRIVDALLPIDRVGQIDAQEHDQDDAMHLVGEARQNDPQTRQGRDDEGQSVTVDRVAGRHDGHNDRRKAQDQQDIGDVAADHIPHRDAGRACEGRGNTGNQFRRRCAEPDQRQPYQQGGNAQLVRSGNGAAHQSLAACEQAGKPGGNQDVIHGRSFDADAARCRA